MIQGLYAGTGRRRKPAALAAKMVQWGPIMLIASTYLLILLGTRPFGTVNRWNDLKEGAASAAARSRPR